MDKLTAQDAISQLTEEMTSPDDDQTTEAAPVVEENIEDLDLSDETGEVIETDDSPAIDAPSSWSKDDAEHFSTLPPEVQQRIANRERDRDLNIRQSQDQNADERKALKADRDSVNQQKADFLESFKAYGPKKPSRDMLNPESENHDPDAYHAKMAKFEDAKEQADNVDQEIRSEDAKSLQLWQTNEVKNYEKILPDFVDEKKGPAYRRELADYAVKEMGLPLAEISKLFLTTPANQMSMMAKAMKWDNAMAKQKANGTKPKPKTLKGGNNNPSKPVKKSLNTAAAKYKQNPTKANAAALFEVK